MFTNIKVNLDYNVMTLKPVMYKNGGGPFLGVQKIMKNAIFQESPYFNPEPTTRKHAPY